MPERCALEILRAKLYNHWKDTLSENVIDLILGVRDALDLNAWTIAHHINAGLARRAYARCVDRKIRHANKPGDMELALYGKYLVYHGPGF